MSARVHVVSRPGAVSIHDPDLFATGREARAELFARRAFRCADLRALRLEPARAMATLEYAGGATPDGPAAVNRMARALAAASAPGEVDLPPWRPGEAVAVRRFGRLLSTVEVLSLGRRRLSIRHPALRSEPRTARGLEVALSAHPGVDRVMLTSRTAALAVRFDPRTVSVRALLRQIETALAQQPVDAPAGLCPDPPGLALPLAALALSAAADLAVPALLPAAGALSVLANLDTLGAAVGQLAVGKVGLPALQAAIVISGLFTGSFLPGAVSLGLLRLWEGQQEHDLARGTAALAALVEEAGRPGTRLARAPGDEVAAGSRVSAGRLEATVLRSGGGTRAARLAQAAIAGALAPPSPWAPTPRAERFATRGVLPTLALAALAGLARGPGAATAVMRPDYATGVGVAESLRRLQASRAALREGVLVRSHEALRRLGEASWLVLDDLDALDATAIRPLQDAGVRIFLASARPPAEAAELARTLGVDAHLGGLDGTGRARLLGGLRERAVAFLHVTDHADPLDPRGDEVIVAGGEPGVVDPDAGIALLSGTIASLPSLHALSRAMATEDRRDRWRTVLVNAASTAAVLALEWTSLPVIGLANANILVSRNRARRSLEGEAVQPRERRPPPGASLAPSSRPSARVEPSDLLRTIEDLPADLGGVLVTVGVLGLVLPGLAGWPFLIAGAAVLLPGGRKRLARWAARHPSRIVHIGVEQVSRLAADLERRYPTAPARPS